MAGCVVLLQLSHLLSWNMTKTEAQPSASNGAAMDSSTPPQSSLQARDLPSAVNSKELLDAHVARTGGKVCALNVPVLLRPSNAC